MSLDIEYIEKIVPDAYHGTSKYNADNILRSGFRISLGDEQYLGNGVYFFEGSETDAAEWAKRSFPPSECVVIQAILNLGRCLDFHNPEHAAVIIEAKNALETRQAALPGGHPEKTMTITDALVINGLASLCEIDTVRASHIVTRQKKIFPGSHFYSSQQLIICVRKLARILRLKIV